MTRISIIIPTYNEEQTVTRLFRQLEQLYPAPTEIIVVDGGSTDQTRLLVEQYNQTSSTQDGKPVCQLIRSPVARRSYQMNLGARSATGDYLCFLHADTALPDDALMVIEQTLADSRTVVGGFISLMRGPLQTQWFISFLNFAKTSIIPLLFRPHLFFRGGRLLVGDQVIFCRRQPFLDCGGYDDELPIMEEADMLLRIVQYGRIRQVNRVVESSDRRVVKWGVWRATGIYLYVFFLWGVGYSPDKLKQLYKDIR